MMWRGIGQAPDPASAARCLARANRWHEIIPFYLNGWGVPRDVVRARVILERTSSPDPDLTEQRLAQAVDTAQAEASPPFRSWDWCKDIAATTLDVNHCLAVDRLVADWQASLARDHLFAELDPAVAPLWDALDDALVAWVSAESDLAYYRNIDGTLRDAAAMAAAQQCESLHDALLQQLVRHRKLPPTRDAEVARLAAAVRALDAALAPRDKGIQFDPQRYVAYRRARDSAWTRYQKAWIALAAAVAPDVTPSEVNIALLRERESVARAQSESH